MNKRVEKHEKADISNEEGRQAGEPDRTLGRRGSTLSHEPPKPATEASTHAGDYPGAQTKDKHPRFTAPGDPDAGKGAVEGDSRTRQRTNTTMEGQLPHRTESRLVKANDSDFPEPGSNPEHSGQRSEKDEPRSPERDVVQQDPGERQKRNQGNEKDDPLAA